MNDNQIIVLYQQKNADAIAESNRKYGAYCFSVADNILHSNEDAEECVNDTWLRAWNAIPPHNPHNLKLFLAKITRNLAFNRFQAQTAKKRGGTEISLVLDELSECIAVGATVETTYEAQELEQILRAFVYTLPMRDRNVFVRRYFFTEAAALIAQRYNLTENHVLVILSRTRKKLKLHLIKEGYFYE